MSTLIKAKIDVKKINKELLFTGKKGVYLDLDIWINDRVDDYGNDVSIEQSVEKDNPKIYIGNGKVKWTSEKTATDVANETVSSQPTEDDLPF